MCGYLGKISLENIDFDSINNSNNRIICRGPDHLKSLNSKIGDYNLQFILRRWAL